MTSVRYERRKLTDLVPNAANPRRIKPAARAGLLESLKAFGQVLPIVVNEATGRIVGGHQRVELLLEMGEEEADVAIGSWTEDEERALNATLNNPRIQGQFTGDTRDFLTPILRSLSLDDFKRLRLDGLGGTAKQPDHASVVETGPVRDEFWISVRGPLAAQAETLQVLRERLGKIAGVTVEVGTIRR